ncbi:lactonase family protein [Flammeovirga agarivorans]|uniref:Lactonase family protein n=1 Tax=Flammeovirga agarivorans TaxID=2726742 RepID=A0A7X8SHG8_9BACT|nr:lactonase family protein [Flammeovirga agarivorans]NLR90269.1 lactonase family protein [Flammeovirga agarivorans]
MKKKLMTVCAMLLGVSTYAQDFLVGTYTKEGSEGIYKVHLDAKNATLEMKGVAAKSVQPSYVAYSKDRKFAVAVNETDGGEISLFTVDKSTGDLTFVNKVPSGGAHPCHVSLDGNNTVFVANYSGGNVGVFQIKDGLLTPFHQLIQYEGEGPNKSRQEAAHAHFANYDSKLKKTFTVDLGSDKVHIYNVKETKLEEVQTLSTPAGGGPRHLVAHGNILYVLNELEGKITIYITNEEGQYKELANVSTLPEDFKEYNTCAAIKMSKDGKFLYASNRGHNSITIFKVDKGSGLIANIGYQDVQGKSPRDFTLSPKEDFIVVANQDSNNLSLFERNKKTGLLEFKTILEMSMPVNVVF